MNFDRDPTNTDEYSVTASQIFDYCGADKSGVLHVDALMEKFVPFVKTNKAEFSHLKNLLDPDQSNPEINVTKLANTLHKYSESQKTKIDLDESFNLRNGQAPQDSDSGISSDGLQLLEELQCELKEKEHLAHKLRSQLDFTDRQHEETIAGLIAERDALKKSLNIAREENITLSQLRADYEEAVERAATADTARAHLARELDAMRKRCRLHSDQIAALETDKLTLQELLSKSKDECHRINEMYASRQSFLLEQNEALKAEGADLAAKLQDFEDYMQQILKEKLVLEMELKDSISKCNQSNLRLDRSIDVSYTDDNVLTQLDSLNADSKFAPENRILDEESFLNVLKEDQGRATNMSLFDEIRLSFCNKSRLNFTENNQCERCNMNSSLSTIGTQTDEGYNECKLCIESEKVQITVASTQTQTDLTFTTDYEPYSSHNKTEISMTTTETQTDDSITSSDNMKLVNIGSQTIGCLLKPRVIRVVTRAQSKLFKNKNTVETQTEEIEPCCSNNNDYYGAFKNKNTVETQTEEIEPCCSNNNDYYGPCFECEKAYKYISQLENKIASSEALLSEMENNFDYLQKVADEERTKNESLENLIESFKEKVDILEAACGVQSEVLDRILPETCCAICQTETDQSSVSTQVETACAECEKRSAVVPHRRLRNFFWEGLKCLFQVFAVVCFICAVSMLYGAGVSRRHAACREGRVAPWRWLDPQDIMDLLLRIEYTADVPM